MNEKQLRTVVGNLRRVISPNPASRIADAQLLERFLQCRDELAFETLVWRHGSMVLNVCRRVLRDSHEAEDAFQATFLIFVRKLRSIGKREAVGSWLYKVAYRVALRAKERTVARGLEPHADLDQRPGKGPDDDPAQAAAWRDLRPVLDEEVSRLPEKYRTPFVLYYLEGMAYPEVAAELGCPKGTVSSRLTTAKGLLRKRLLQRGVALSAALLATALTKTVSASLTIGLTNTTMQTIHLVASGKTAGASSAQAITLAEGVMKAMMMTKVKLAAMLVLAVGLLGYGATVVVQQMAQAAPPATAEGPTLKAPTTLVDKPKDTTKPPSGIALGEPTPADSKPADAGPNNTARGQEKALPQRFIDWPIANTKWESFPLADDTLAARLTKIEDRLTHLEAQMAKLQPKSTTSSSAGGGVTTGTSPPSPFQATGGDKPLPINTRHFNLPIAMDEKEQSRIAKVELHVSKDQGVKWAFVNVIDADQREFHVRVPADGEYWFKLHVIYKFGPTPEADFGTKTKPELKVLVNTKPLHSYPPKADDNDALLSDLETQLKALQQKIAELKAKQARE